MGPNCFSSTRGTFTIRGRFMTSCIQNNLQSPAARKLCTTVSPTKKWKKYFHEHLLTKNIHNKVKKQNIKNCYPGLSIGWEL